MFSFVLLVYWKTPFLIGTIFGEGYPTARRVFQMMEGVDVLTIEQGDIHQRLILNLTDLRKQIVRLFGPHVRKLYDLLE